MKTGATNIISINLKRIFSITKPQMEKLDTEMGVSRLLPDKVLLKEEDSHPETKARLVTYIKNNISDSPYNLRVTGKWTVPNKTHRFSVPGAILCFSLLLFTLSVNIFFFHKLYQQYKECLRAVTMLENVVKHLEAENENLQEKLNKFHHNYIPSTYQTSSEVKLSFDSTAENSLDSEIKPIRSKRSNIEACSHCRSCTTKNIALQFSGSKPYGHSILSPKGILGPWIESSNNFSNVEKFGAKLGDHNSTLEISRDGMYMIYAQVTYQSINVSTSYTINVKPNTDGLLSQPITTCSSFGKILKYGEISCYTSVVKLLNAGDIIFVQQAQPDRDIIFTKSYTYFGLIYLN